MADQLSNWVSAISSAFSAAAASLSLGAFLYAMKMQKEDSINDVRPELLLLDWTIEDRDSGNLGPCTSIHSARVKNVGRGPAFEISYMSLDPMEPKRQIYAATQICPYVAADADESIEIGSLTQWNKLPHEAICEEFEVQLFYSDLGQRRHSVKMHLVIARNTNYSYSGAKRLAPRLFMTRRETTVIQQTVQHKLQGQVNRLRAWWRKITAVPATRS